MYCIQYICIYINENAHIITYVICLNFLQGERIIKSNKTLVFIYVFFLIWNYIIIYLYLWRACHKEFSLLCFLYGLKFCVVIYIYMLCVFLFEHIFSSMMCEKHFFLCGVNTCVYRQTICYSHHENRGRVSQLFELFKYHFWLF